MVKVVLFPGGRQTPMRVNLRLTTRGALSRHRCRGVRLRKQARLYYKMPADGPGGRLDLLVDPSSNLSTKYTFLYPGLHLIPRTSLHASTVSRSRSRALLGDSILLFLSELVDAGQRALCIAETRNPVAAVQTQPRRLPTSVPTAPQCSSFIRSGSATPVVRSGGNAKTQPLRAFS
jgi:hypothetical protein